MIVLSVGGSLINPGTPDLVFLKNIASLLRDECKKEPIGIVTGGGAAARTYADAIRKAGGGEFQADEAAILSTKQNALLLIAALGDVAYPLVCRDFDEAAEASVTHKIVVMGGTIPGITTDTDAALLAEKTGAKRLINLSNIDAIYDSDPKKNKNAKRYAELSFEKMLELASESDKRTAGTHFIFDLVACKIIARSKIVTHFIHGRDMECVKSALAGKKDHGTIVK
ncbi:UMP kinase [Candidatus Micrarchaeota archaeon]|nr:UMP kinase [Candidatus Micrarchaeota archaeon]